MRHLLFCEAAPAPHSQDLGIFKYLGVSDSFCCLELCLRSSLRRAMGIVAQRFWRIWVEACILLSSWRQLLASCYSIGPVGSCGSVSQFSNQIQTWLSIQTPWCPMCSECSFQTWMCQPWIPQQIGIYLPSLSLVSPSNLAFHLLFLIFYSVYYHHYHHLFIIYHFNYLVLYYLNCFELINFMTINGLFNSFLLTMRNLYFAANSIWISPF